MKQEYAEYYIWEDYKNRMYDSYPIEKEEELINSALEILCSPKLFLSICYDVLTFWEIASKNNLTNTNSNRRAWLGQAACSYYSKVPEILTRKAWALMTDQQRIEANKIADKIIYIFESNHEKKNKQLYNKMDTISLF